jgi:hypothetical protein
MAKKVKSKKNSKDKIKKELPVNEQLYKDLTSVRVLVKGRLYEIDLSDELLVGIEDVGYDVERIPAVMGYFGSIVSILQKEWKNKRDLLKKVEALIDKKIRESGIRGEVRIDKAIKRHPKWIEACVEVNDSQESFLRAKSLYNSLKSKEIALAIRSADIRTIPGDRIIGVSSSEVIKFKDDFFSDEDDNFSEESE